MSVSKLKYYFAVDTTYVAKKLAIVLCPFTHTVSSKYTDHADKFFCLRTFLELLLGYCKLELPGPWQWKFVDAHFFSSTGFKLSWATWHQIGSCNFYTRSSKSHVMDWEARSNLLLRKAQLLIQIVHFFVVNFKVNKLNCKAKYLNE